MDAGLTRWREIFDFPGPTCLNRRRGRVRVDPTMLEAPIAAIDTVVQSEELIQLLESAEVAGTVRAPEILEIVEPYALDALELDSV